MMLKTYITFFLFVVFTAVSAQKKSKTAAENEADSPNYQLNKLSSDWMTSNTTGAEFHFIFPNVNVVYDFYDKSALDKIQQLETENDLPALITELEKYIMQFGIHNFSEDTELIWKLAQLYESTGEIEKAKAAYRLVLRHHKTDLFPEIKQYFGIMAHYDSLTVTSKNYYVPLEYYYELVEYRKKIDTLTPPKSILLNMGDLVNKRRIPDYGPSISKQDNVILFTRKAVDNHLIVRGNHFNEDLYYSQQYGDFWDEALPFPEPINSRCNEGSACLSKDGKTLFFSRCFVPDFALDCSDCMGKCDIYVSTKEGDKWSKPKNLGKEVNSVAWDSHPALSANEDTLYFASDRPGGFGLSDIYFTYLKKGKWMPAQNLGPIVNTRNNEYSPFVNWAYNIFYFSSNGQLFNFNDLENKKRLRTLDIYKTKLHADWTEEPKNIGPLVNGDGNEFYFTIDSKSEQLYYAKTEEESKDELTTDLYSFPMPMEARPNATTKLKGTLTDKETGDPYRGIVSVIDLDNGIEVAPKKTRPDGSYEFDLINHKNYLLVIQGDDFFRIEELLKLTQDTTIDSKATSIRNKTLQFASLVFANGKADILPSMEKDLWDVINFLVDNPTYGLAIGGHTDSDGDKAANKLLSQRRADAIKNFIVNEGFIDPNRITAIGYGSDKPIRKPEITDEDKETNRRVEFEIIYNQPVEENTEKENETDEEW